MAEHVAAVTPAERVDEWIDTPLNRANFGFADNTVRVTAQLKDGRSIGFQFGADAPTETPSVYFLLDQDPYLYTMPASVRDLFDQGLHFLHTVPDISTADTSDILAISVSTSERSVRLLSVGTTWALTEPLPYPASSDAMQRLLSTVQQLRLAYLLRILTIKRICLPMAWHKIPPPLPSKDATRPPLCLSWARISME